jgi:hypothetical protein
VVSPSKCKEKKERRAPPADRRTPIAVSSPICRGKEERSGERDWLLGKHKTLPLGITPEEEKARPQHVK